VNNRITVDLFQRGLNVMGKTAARTLCLPYGNFLSSELVSCMHAVFDCNCFDKCNSLFCNYLCDGCCVAVWVLENQLNKYVFICSFSVNYIENTERYVCTGSHGRHVAYGKS